MNALDDHMLEKLKGLEIAPSEKVWTQVESSLPPTNRLPAWWWLPIAASFLLAVFVYRPEVEKGPAEEWTTPASEESHGVNEPLESISVKEAGQPAQNQVVARVPSGQATTQEAPRGAAPVESLPTEGLATVELDGEAVEETPTARPSVKVKMKIRPRPITEPLLAEDPGLSQRLLTAASEEFKDFYGRTEQEAQRIAGNTLRFLKGEPNEMSNQSP